MQGGSTCWTSVGFFFPASQRRRVGRSIPGRCHRQHRGSAAPRHGSVVEPGLGSGWGGPRRCQPSGREALCSTWVQESSRSWPPSSLPRWRCLFGSGTAAPSCLLAPFLRHVSSTEHPSGGWVGASHRGAGGGSVTSGATSLLGSSGESRRLGLGTPTSPLLPAALPLVWLWTSPAPVVALLRGSEPWVSHWDGHPAFPNRPSRADGRSWPPDQVRSKPPRRPGCCGGRGAPYKRDRTSRLEHPLKIPAEKGTSFGPTYVHLTAAKG